MSDNAELQRRVDKIANLTEWEYFVGDREDFETDEDYENAEYYDDPYDINYIINSNGSYLGVRLLVAFGGPNIWIDTVRGVVDGFWGVSASANLNDELLEAINNYYKEIYECTR